MLRHQGRNQRAGEEQPESGMLSGWFLPAIIVLLVLGAIVRGAEAVPAGAGAIEASEPAGESVSGASAGASVLNADTASLKLASLKEEYVRLRSETEAYKDMRAPETLRSANGKGNVRIGGEFNTDYIVNWRKRGGGAGDFWSLDPAWSLHSTNLRFTIDLAENLRVFLKLDLSSNQDYLENQLLEEARIVWDNLGGGPLGVFFGKGEAPYGQDRTLGIIQSYHHSEGSYSAEGPTILSGPIPNEPFDSEDAFSPVYHPGEIDRVVMGGLNFSWMEVIKAEFAVYQPWDWKNRTGNRSRDSDFGLESFCGRVWWNTPVEGLVAEVSGVRQHMRARGDNGRYGPDAVEDEYAASAGLDYNLPSVPVEIFTEYEHGWDWNYTQGYDTDTFSLGAMWRVTQKVELGAMAEWLHINDRGTFCDYNKLVLHGGYYFENGVYMMAEYGAELYNWNASLTQTLALRTGVRF